MTQPTTGSGERDPQDTRIVEEFLRARDEGEIRTLEEFCARYPESQREEVRSLCARVQGIEGQIGSLQELPEPLGNGQVLSHYEILAPLGKGGMGEVYRAKDTKLHREVALKVLPPDMSADPDRVKRFEREARAIAALDHPNIVTVHSVEQAEGLHFITMQLVEGNTLAARIPRKGLPLEEFFDLAIPMAEGISAAHEQGITHRDLKPANIMVTNEGRVKILDFGLAKLRKDVGPAATTQTVATSLTEEGKILGTVAYMSPEQAEGKAVDHRTDIFSLGIILYEMTTGERPFKGDSMVSLVSSIVKDTPTSVHQLNRLLPIHLGRIVRRSLEKDPDRRFQTAKDLRNELENLRQEISSGEIEVGVVASGDRKADWRRTFPVWLVACLTLAVVGLAAAALWPGGAPAAETLEVRHYTEPVVDGMWLWGGRNEELETGRPTRTALALSPDGKTIVYSATDGTSSWLFRRRIDVDTRAIRIEGTEGASGPFFQSDGQGLEVGFHDEEAMSIKVIPLEGGTARTVASDLTHSRRGASWTGDYIVFPTVREIYRVRASGGTREQLSRRLSSRTQPQVLPGGALIFTLGGTLQTHVNPPGEDSRFLIDGTGAIYWARTGHLLFGREGTLYAAGLDLESTEIMDPDPPAVLEDKVVQAYGATQTTLNTQALQVAVSESGSILYAPGAVPDLAPVSFFVVDDQGQERLDSLGSDSYRGSQARLSPDGTRLAVSVRGLRGLRVLDLDTGGTVLEQPGVRPVWAPGGERLLFASTRGTSIYDLYIRALDGDDAVPLLVTGEHKTPADWALVEGLADGAVLFTQDNDIWWVDVAGALSGEKEPEPFLLTPNAQEHRPVFSPDGKWVAYASDIRGSLEIFVRSFPSGTGEIPVTVDSGGTRPIFSRGEGPPRLFYRTLDDPAEMMGVRYTVENGKFEVEEATRMFTIPYSNELYDVFPDGRFLMREDYDPSFSPITEMKLITNWHTVLLRLVPIK